MYKLCSSRMTGFSDHLELMYFHKIIQTPRHIHMDLSREGLTDECIIILSGFGLLEITDEIFFETSESVVDAVGGFPHIRTACNV